MKTVAVVGTFDSKGQEYLFIKESIEKLGCSAFTIHSGAFEPQFLPDISNEAVASAAGYDIKTIAGKKDRAFAMEALAKGTEIIVPKLFGEGKFDGIISLGGTGGTSLATPAMRALPVGVPKVMVSTVASGDVSPYVGTKDIAMFPSIVDVAGLNSISRVVFSNAASAIVGMVRLKNELPRNANESKPLIAATMFGVTTPCVDMAKSYFEENGYEVLVFHATGTGGKTMESLIEGGFIKGVFDLTTTEWCDELFGGILNAGPNRCEAAAIKGIPTVMSVGATDMVNFGAFDALPPQTAGRNLYKHNSTTTLMRTTAEENMVLGEKLADKLNKYRKPTAMFLPLKGVSMIDAEGQPFYGPKEDSALFASIKEKTKNPNVEIIELDAHINDEIFAVAAARKLVELIESE